LALAAEKNKGRGVSFALSWINLLLALQMAGSREAVRKAITGTLSRCARTGRVSLGQWAEFRRTYGPEEVATFAALSGDHNPVHVDPEFAAQTQFGKPIVHGMLYGGMFGTIFGQYDGSIYVNQQFNFKRPVYVGEEVTARIDVIETKERGNRQFVTCDTVILNPNGDVCTDGKAMVMLPVTADKADSEAHGDGRQ